MSASNEEKKVKRQSAADEQARQEKRSRRGMIIGVVVIAVLAVAAIIINSSLFTRMLTAVKVGNTSYTAAELNVFYRNTYNNLYSYYEDTYGDYVSYFVDTDSDEWKQQVYDQTLENMQQITALYDAAKSEGYALPEADRSAIDSQLSAVETYASVYGYTTDSYITAIYGKGVTKATLEKVLTYTVTAQSYASAVQDGFTYTQEQLDSYYAEHADEYDYINYYYYTVSTSADAFADLEDDDAKKSAAHDAAEEIAKAADADALAAAVEEFNEDAAPSEQYLQGGSLSGNYSEWLLDGARKAGDTTVIDTDSGSTVLLYVARDGNDYDLRNMRHILIDTESTEDEDGNYVYTEEAGEAAKAKIEEIRAEYEADPTEDHFAELANEYSEDSGSNTNGGLYENIRKRQMVTNINDFLFNETHTPGDVAVLFGENGYYQGWHLVYYAGEGQLYKDYLSENAQRSADYDSYLENLTASYEVTTGAGLTFASLS